MDLLKAAIASKRKRPEGEVANGPGSKRRKYKTKRERDEEAAEAAGDGPAATARVKKEKEEVDAEAAAVAASAKEAAAKEQKSGDTGQTGAQSKDEKKAREEKATLPAEEVKKRLRSYNEVVTFFGESDVEREKRLFIFESDAETMEYRKGLKNEFQQQLKDIEEMESQVGEEEEKTLSMKKRSARKKALQEFVPENQQQKVYAFFKLRLIDWEEELDARTDDQKRSVQGKNDLATMRQTENYLKPLMKMLRKPVPETSNEPGALTTDILEHLHRIVCFLEEREYVKAHDQYLQLAIGNAPWPIGVTMVGIHERSGREKIFSNKIAHVLNDEVQRKYIQSVKRLMSYCQTKYPTDPSKSVG
eukprot:TRINITY_DN8327_c0_g1_i1.p1 TRINITY_DN8327_c0_g1~~TRINITY_DN8327_c0_g1_i1.p1  ORF type:complete len:398 (-),score=154.99 TRINITY_DN8327_c0_g1_i1:256-1338(-)